MIGQDDSESDSIPGQGGDTACEVPGPRSQEHQADVVRHIPGCHDVQGTCHLLPVPGDRAEQGVSCGEGRPGQGIALEAPGGQLGTGY